MRFIFYSLVILTLFQTPVFGQAGAVENGEVVELFGVVMTADSVTIPLASVVVVGKRRGTLTNHDGVFSIAVLKGDKVLFSCVGFKSKEIEIPKNLKGNQYNIMPLLANDVSSLPEAMVKFKKPTHEEFERDFINMSIPNDAYEIARQNISETRRNSLIQTLPIDGREAVNYQLRQQADKYYYSGQLPPINLFNPFAWAAFIKAWKRGDFKTK